MRMIEIRSVAEKKDYDKMLVKFFCGICIFTLLIGSLTNHMNMYVCDSSLLIDKFFLDLMAFVTVSVLSSGSALFSNQEKYPTDRERLILLREHSSLWGVLFFLSALLTLGARILSHLVASLFC